MFQVDQNQYFFSGLFSGPGRGLFPHRVIPGSQEKQQLRWFRAGSSEGWTRIAAVSKGGG